MAAGSPKRPKRAAKAKSEDDPTAPPDHLGPDGSALWTALHSELPQGFVFDARERFNLEAAATLTDTLTDLRARIEAEGVSVTGSKGQSVLHPAIPEARQTRLAIARHLGAVELPSEETGATETAATIRARSAANARWKKRDHWETRRAEVRKRRRGEA